VAVNTAAGTKLSFPVGSTVGDAKAVCRRENEFKDKLPNFYREGQEAPLANAARFAEKDAYFVLPGDRDENAQEEEAAEKFVSLPCCRSATFHKECTFERGSKGYKIRRNMIGIKADGLWGHTAH
jgi:hypothetical protein